MNVWMAWRHKLVWKPFCTQQQQQQQKDTIFIFSVFALLYLVVILQTSIEIYGQIWYFFLTPFSSLPFGDFCLVLLTNINANNTYKEKLHKIKFFSLLLSRSVRVNVGMRWNRFSCYKNFQIYKSRPNYSINLLV